MGYVRFSIVILKPTRSHLIRLHRSLQIPQIILVQLGKILFVSCRSSKIAFHCIVIDRLLQHSRRILWIILPIAFIRLCQCICRIVRLLEAVRLYRGGFLECLPGFFTRFLQPEGVCGLCVELDGAFVFLCLAAE